MTTPTTSFALGKYARLKVGPAPTDDGVRPADNTFKLVETENEIELTWKSDKEKVKTKSKGSLTLPEGDEEWQIKATCDAALADEGYAELLATMSGARWVQIVDTKTSKVQMEGVFTASDMSFKAPQAGVRQSTFTLDNSDAVNLYLATGGRATS
ncbi:hypothetical protein [Sphingomonas sp. Leaf28]|uniref:hypothetical protein n=1 Tax=Sphingomonas sp. Leaf28 TaxID=1735695 RepID=UPI0006FCBB72|nr:hypothetical protein [Sphingomonas sp. Leaf28]KQN09073.1 hypothetical protein ASE79_14570 [Sphingomonas sp. Leaf28]